MVFILGGKKMNRKILAFALCSSIFFNPARAIEILYDLGPGWSYLADFPATLTLTELPNAGVKVDMNVPENLNRGGLSESRHDLPGLIFDADNFVQLHYSSYSVTTAAGASPEITLGLEFRDTNDDLYELGLTLTDNGGTLNFDGSLECGSCIPEISQTHLANLPATSLDIEQGSLGVARYGNRVLFYLIDKNDTLVFPLDSFDVSQITGAHSFQVDNDFEALTGAGESVVASVVFEKVEYDAGGPRAPPPECDIQLNALAYMEGDTVTATIFRIANLSDTALAIEIKTWLAVPGLSPISVINAGADGSLVFSAGQEIDLGPAPLFDVTAAFPRGNYEFSCRMRDPVTGELLAEDLNSFDIR